MLARSASSRRINDTRKACVMLALGSLMLRALIPLGMMYAPTDTVMLMGN